MDINDLKNKIFENITIPKKRDGKTLIFERMNIVEGGENTLPPGFDISDIEPLEAGLCNDGTAGVSEASEMDPIEVGGSDTKLANILKNRAGGVKNKKSDPIIHGTTLFGNEKKGIKGIMDDTGKEVDPEKLKQLLSKRPPVILNQNGKMGKTNVYSITLPKYRGIFYDEKENKLKIVNTCPNAKDCVLTCYAGKAGYVMFPRSSEKSGQVLNYLLNDYVGWKNQLLKEINAHEMRNSEIGQETVIRWHDSGDFISEKYIDLAIDIANQTPDVTHYAYTKEVGSTKDKQFPENFIIRHSFGGLQNDLIDKSKRYAEVVPKEDYKPFIKKEKVGEDTFYRYINDESVDGLKQVLAKKHGLDINTILTYKELLRTKETSDKPHWNVIVTPSNGDNAAYRKDVSGVFLLYH